MRIKSKPENFSGSYPNALFEIDGAESIAVIDVSVKNEQDNTIGIKRLTGEESYSINIAPYLREAIKVEPYYAAVTGFLNHSERTCRTRIKAERLPVGDIYFLPIFSEWVNFTAGRESVGEEKILSQTPSIIDISRNGSDEIAFCTSGSEVYADITVSVGSDTNTIRIANVCDEPRNGQEWFTCTEGMTALHLSIGDVLTDAGIDQAERVEVSIHKKTAAAPGNELFASRKYRIIQSSYVGVELYWVNQYGAIDHYTFGGISKEEFSAKKSTIRTNRGNIVTGIETANIITVASECESMQTMRWLAGIAASEHVWMREKGEYREVYVDDTDVCVYDASEPVPLVLNIRSK